MSELSQLTRQWSTLSILIALWGGPSHGYVIMKQIQDDEMVGSTTLYRNIREMLEAGLIEKVPAPREGDKRRVYYQITELGEKVLSDRVGFLRKIIEKYEADRK